MDDKEFYEALDRQICNLMEGASRIVLQDIGELNEVCMELTRRRKKYLCPTIQEIK